jgi:hypothetical protein
MKDVRKLCNCSLQNPYSLPGFEHEIFNFIPAGRRIEQILPGQCLLKLTTSLLQWARCHNIYE